jgi:uroporphyrinogen decarboxylase
MTSRERVLTAFAHEEPDRVPLWCGASPEFWAKMKAHTGIADDEALRVRIGDDFRRVTAAPPPDPALLSPGAESRTVFGIERHGIGYGQPMTHPLAGKVVADVYAYPWADPAAVDVSGLRAAAQVWGGRYAMLGGDWSPFWHDAIDLVGMEELYLRMYDDREFMDAVMGHLVDYYAEVSRRIFDAAADVLDIFFIGNDLGSQTGPLLGEGLFRRYILPQLKRLVDLGHDYGLKVMLHCCGGFEPLLPAMIEIGLDAVHAIQPCCAGMDLATLKTRYGERIVFNGAIDSQHVLIEGDPETVRRQVRRVLEVMMPGGGYIAGASHDYILEETPAENVLAMLDTVMEYGRYG